MRNLYKRLGISSSSSTEEIKAAIRKCADSSVREDASTVLLDDRRRGAYNQLNAVLLDVGLLRARLGLGHASNWQGPVASEYTQTNDLSRTMLEELTKKIEAIKRTDSSGSTFDSVGRWLGSYFMTILVIGFFGIIISLFEKDASPPPKSTSYSTKDSSFKTEFNQKALPLPSNGTTRLHVSLEKEAPFQIKTSSGNNYLVKLENFSTGSNVLDIFVRSGVSVEVDVPLGTYIVKYASGKTWYGYDHYFGPQTVYSKADSLFNFRIEGDKVVGYTITLYGVAGGNLHVTQIDPKEF